MDSEKIKELYFQATKWCEENAVGTPIAWEFEEKFAELIVRECIDIANNYVREGPAPPTAKSIIGIKIKEHFGLENKND